MNKAMGVAVVVVLFASALAASPAHAESHRCPSDLYPLAKQGKQLFRTKGVCFGCHGMDGDGKYTDPEVAVLDPKPTDFTKPETLKYPSDDERYSAIRNGIKGTGMAPFRGILTEPEIRLIIEYLEILKTRGC